MSTVLTSNQMGTALPITTKVPTQSDEYLIKIQFPKKYGLTWECLNVRELKFVSFEIILQYNYPAQIWEDDDIMYCSISPYFFRYYACPPIINIVDMSKFLRYKWYFNIYINDVIPLTSRRNFGEYMKSLQFPKIMIYIYGDGFSAPFLPDCVHLVVEGIYVPSYLPKLRCDNCDNGVLKLNNMKTLHLINCIIENGALLRQILDAPKLVEFKGYLGNCDLSSSHCPNLEVLTIIPGGSIRIPELTSICWDNYPKLKTLSIKSRDAAKITIPSTLQSLVLYLEDVVDIDLKHLIALKYVTIYCDIWGKYYWKNLNTIAFPSHLKTVKYNGQEICL